METIDRKFHNRHCLVWIDTLPQVLRGMVSVAASGNMVTFNDGTGDRPIQASSIRDIQLDED